MTHNYRNFCESIKLLGKLQLIIVVGIANMKKSILNFDIILLYTALPGRAIKNLTISVHSVIVQHSQ